jgi:hypothetical protein
VGANQRTPLGAPSGNSIINSPTITPALFSWVQVSDNSAFFTDGLGTWVSKGGMLAR